MSNAASSARARAAINRRGELVSVRRLGSGTPRAILNRADVKAIVAGYSPVELVNGITQGSRRVILSQLDLDAAGFPPLKKSDWIYLGDTFQSQTAIQGIDPDHREYQGCLDISVLGT